MSRCHAALAVVTGIVCLVGFGCERFGIDDSAGRRRALEREITGLRASQAALRSRLSLSKQDRTYVIVDLPEREIRMELGGVPLARVPIRKVELNRTAEEISNDTTRIRLSESPFVLEAEEWYEEVLTLALKDSAAVKDRPDTTGVLAEQVRKSRVLGLLRLDRGLVISLNGTRKPVPVIGGIVEAVQSLLRLTRSATGEWTLRKERRSAVFVGLDLEPADVRTFAPNLRPGTKLVVLF